MKISNKTVYPMSDKLNDALIKVRSKRNFNVMHYFNTKVAAIELWCKRNSIKGLVIGVSGGIDSAVSLAIPKNVKGVKVQAYSFISPKMESLGFLSNQQKILDKVTLLSSSLGITIKVINTDDVANSIMIATNTDSQKKWVGNQYIPVIRTNLLYTECTKMSDDGINTCVVGTSNLDEIGYLGYVGKYSDGMVDLQIISDIHKSEVVELARFLDIPDPVILDEPNGDMYDNRTDEQMFGTTYDFIELYRYIINNEIFFKADDSYMKNVGAINEMIRHNAHKYQVGSPAYHVDIMESGCCIGRPFNLSQGYYKELEKVGDYIGTYMVNPVFLPPEILKYSQDFKALIDAVENFVLSKYATNTLVCTNEYGKQTASTNGSQRFSFYSVEFSKRLFAEIQKTVEYNTPTNSTRNTNDMYIPVGVNPYIRVLVYDEGQYIDAHYDDTFVYSSSVRSLRSLLVGVSNYTGGETRFYSSPKDSVYEKTITDGLEIGDSLIDVKHIQKGQIVAFDHYVKHDACPVKKGIKVLLRSEIMYQKV